MGGVGALERVSAGLAGECHPLPEKNSVRRESTGFLGLNGARSTRLAAASEHSRNGKTPE